MIRYLLSFILVLVSSSVFAGAGCKIGAVYKRSGMSGDSYEYAMSLPYTGPNGVISSPAQLMGFYMEYEVMELVEDGQLNSVALATSGGNIQIGGISCPVSFWTITGREGAIAAGPFMELAKYAFPTANLGSDEDAGGGSGGDFGKFYTPSGETFNTVISDFRGRVEEGSLFKVIKDWFVLSSIVSSCPRYEFRVPMFDKTADISLASVFCSETSDKLFSLVKTIMLVGVAAIGMRIAFT